MQDILRAHDWRQYSKITDLYGDSGTFLATILSVKGHEQQQGVLVQPSILAKEGKEVATRLADSYDLSGRMTFTAGDLNQAGTSCCRGHPTHCI